MAANPHRSNQGFTIIELVIVVVVIGILAVTAGPVFFGREGFDENFFQARLHSVLRLQQQRAMQNTTQCFGVRIEADRFGAVDDCAAVAIPNPLPSTGSGISTSEAVSANVTIASSAVTVPYTLAFNALGCPIEAPGKCEDAVNHEFTITGVSSLKVCVGRQGYIDVGACP